MIFISTSVGTLIFSSYVGLGPASTVYQKKIFDIFATPKRMYQIYPPPPPPPQKKKKKKKKKYADIGIERKLIENTVLRSL